MQPCLFWLFRPLFVRWEKEDKEDESASTRVACATASATKNTDVLEMRDVHPHPNAERHRTGHNSA